MHILIVTDAYFPSRTSVAVLLYELAQTFIEDDIKVSIIVPDSGQSQSFTFKMEEGCQIISVKALQAKDVNYIQRTLCEFINPWLVWFRLKQSSQFMNLSIDGMIWYSPTIFWGPLIKRLKRHFHCRSYLILRDIFPDWALHLGMLKRGAAFAFFKAAELYQYRQANAIGIQSPNNLKYFQQQHPTCKAKLEVLWNWAIPLDSISKHPSSITIKETALAGRIIFVYAGNIGVAQGAQTLLNLINRLKDNLDIGFLIVCRGSEAGVIRNFVQQKQLDNTVVSDEIPHFEIPSLFEQCDVGMMFLDRRHKTHNIPGKFVTYLQSGLPVLAVVNPGNDLMKLIPSKQIGEVYDGDDLEVLTQKTLTLAKEVRNDDQINQRCKSLANTQFASKTISHQILSTFRLHED